MFQICRDSSCLRHPHPVFVLGLCRYCCTLSFTPLPNKCKPPRLPAGTPHPASTTLGHQGSRSTGSPVSVGSSDCGSVRLLDCHLKGRSEKIDPKSEQ